MKFPGWLGILSFSLVSAVGVLGAAPETEPPVDAKELPHAPPLEPKHALETFQIKPGFRAELVASEPLVADPIAVAFDENGRMFVVEMRDYSERRDEKLGRIRMLEDTDGDGRYDKSTIFAEGLPWPTAVVCYDGGIFVGATPDIIYLKDRDGDGKADVREVVFTGFGSGVARLNVQQLFNSFQWSLDNRIHGANGGNGGVITCPKRPNEPPINLRGRDFSFDPRTLDFRLESGGGQYGMTFDDRGRKYVCSNSSHIRAVMYEDRYAARNPYFVPPPAAADIAVDGPAAEVYRISPDEPWRVLRTKWRVAGLVPGPIEGGGRASGYFTSATGITIYRGDAWPAEFRGDAFIADCGSNLVHRKKVRTTGLEPQAERASDEQKVEFLTSRDLWFRPVQMANAPDGALYIMDMYREVIEHPWSLPQSIKQHLDLNAGNDRGRIYRIVPDGFQQRPRPRLGSVSTKTLVQTLAHPNGWHRDTAARLLFERQDEQAVPELRGLLQDVRSASAGAGTDALGRMHALYVLAGLRRLTLDDLNGALKDSAPDVREHAVRLLEQLPGASVDYARLEALAADSDERVRYQLAFTAGNLNVPDRSALLRQILERSSADAWIPNAVLTSAGAQPSALLNALVASDHFLDRAEAGPFLRQLGGIVGARAHSNEVQEVAAAASRMTSRTIACEIGAGLGEGAQRSGTGLWRLAGGQAMDALLRTAQQVTFDSAVSKAGRMAAIAFLAQAPFDQARKPLLSALRPGEPAEVQQGAIRALSAFSQPEVASDFLGVWDELTPSRRSEVIDALLRRPERATALLSAMEAGRVGRAELSASQVEFLRKRGERSLQERAAQVLGPGPSPKRPDVVKAFSPALGLKGDPVHGRAIYLERCASCHRLAGEGHALGPDLETVRANGKEQLLTNLLDPNREVMPKYVSYLAETKDGESVTGLVSSESDSTIVLRQPNDAQTVLSRGNLAVFRSLGLSVMPEGLEEGLKAQDLADLMEYILTARPGQ